MYRLWTQAASIVTKHMRSILQRWRNGRDNAAAQPVRLNHDAELGKAAAANATSTRSDVPVPMHRLDASDDSDDDLRVHLKVPKAKGGDSQHRTGAGEGASG